MEIIKIYLWSIVIFSLGIFLVYYFIPYLKRKILFWKMSRNIKRMSKRYTGEIRDKLEHISELIKDISKEEKL